MCGLNPIPTWLLEKLSFELNSFLVWLFNSSLSTGYVSSSFNIAQVRPIYSRKQPLTPISSRLIDPTQISVSGADCATLIAMHSFQQHNLLTVDIIPPRRQFWRLSRTFAVLVDLSSFSTPPPGHIIWHRGPWDTYKQIWKIIWSASGGTWMGQILLTLLVENKQYCQLVAMTRLLRASQLAFDRAQSLGQYFFLYMWQI